MDLNNKLSSKHFIVTVLPRHPPPYRISINPHNDLPSRDFNESELESNFIWINTHYIVIIAVNVFVSLNIYTNGLSAERSSWNYDILLKKLDLLCITLRNEKSKNRREVIRLRRQNFESEVITKPHTRVNAVFKTSFRSDGITLFFPSSRLLTYLWSRRVNIPSYLCPPTFCITQLSHLYTPQTISHSVMCYTSSSISRSLMCYTSLFI